MHSCYSITPGDNHSYREADRVKGGGYRLQKCKAELLRQVEGEGHTIALCSKLGAVCGSQGDCHRQLDQPGQAKACYEESVQHLRACNSQDAEVSSSCMRDREHGLCLPPPPTPAPPTPAPAISRPSPLHVSSGYRHKKKLGLIVSCYQGMLHVGIISFFS